jgi:hypothetical protein
MTMEETPFSLRASVFSVLKTLCVKVRRSLLRLRSGSEFCRALLTSIVSSAAR